MTRDDIKQLAETLHDYADTHNYSGRGMYGRECVAVTARTVTEALAQVVNVTDDIDDIRWLVTHFRTDSMGTDTIVYWPDMAWPK
jgi:uncharacterized protein Yka (UPF0111/DUF47 family)